MKNLERILIWLIGIMFIGISVLKYLDLDSMSREVFGKAHLPKWFFYVVATVEFAGGLLLLMTAGSTKRLGVLLIAFVMAGAIGTRWIIHDHANRFVIPVIIFVLAILMYFRLGKRNTQDQ